MGILKGDTRKFKRTVEQHNPTNPTANTGISIKSFEIEEKTFRKRLNKR